MNLTPFQVQTFLSTLVAQPPIVLVLKLMLQEKLPHHLADNFEMVNYIAEHGPTGFKFEEEEGPRLKLFAYFLQSLADHILKVVTRAESANERRVEYAE